MTEENTNTQPDAEVAETPKDDLDTILAEFDQQVEDKPETDSNANEGPRMKVVEDYIQAQQEKDTRRAITESVTQLKEFDKSLNGVGNVAIEGFLQLKAQRDTRIADAFHKRDENPDGWQRVLKGMAHEFSQEFKAPDAQITEDRNAMRAAVETQPETSDSEAPSVSDLNRMSDAEFLRYKESLA